MYHSLSLGSSLAFMQRNPEFMSHAHHVDATKKAGRTRDRRNKARTVISVPVRVRGVISSDRHFDETTTTLNLSPAGILIDTAGAAYYRNMKVSVVLAYEGPAVAGQLEQEGCVVRITELRDGRRSVAIALAHGIGDATAHSEGRNPARAESSHAPKSAFHEDLKSASPLILVVESEVAASAFMKTYLAGEGYEVITAATYSEACSVLDQRTPALLIAEVEGEGMAGYSLCSHCKQIQRLRRVPIMLLTSSAYPSDYAKAHSLGAIVCMAKPYKRERLGHVVRFLAPPPKASRTLASPRPPDMSRQAAAKSTKAPSADEGRRFRLPSVFGR